MRNSCLWLGLMILAAGCGDPQKTVMNVSPIITGVTPAPASSNIPTVPVMTVRVNKEAEIPLDKVSLYLSSDKSKKVDLVEKSSIVGADGSYTVTYEPRVNSEYDLSFKGKYNLENDKSYTFTIAAGIRDMAGNEAPRLCPPGSLYSPTKNSCSDGTAPFSGQWSFTTVSPKGPSSPVLSVISSTPTNGTTGVPTNSTIGLAFSEAVDCSTVNSANISLIGSSSTGFTTTCSGTAVTITPSTNLSSGILYTLTVTTGVKSNTGTGMVSNYRSQFITAPSSSGSGTTVKLIAFAGGGMHSLALRNDGTVLAAGNNDSGQLGTGDNTNRKTFTAVTGGLSSITSVAAGHYHSLALRSDGTVWGWGPNGSGQVGDGSTINRNIPVQVAGLSSVTAIAAGDEHSLALKSDGTVWAWGSNAFGQLGEGTAGPGKISMTPVRISSLSGVTAISAGAIHSLALKNDGTVWAWGNNKFGQLSGDADTSVPVRVSLLPGITLSGITSIKGGELHTVALRNDGTVWTWGSNDKGQLGFKTDPDKKRTTPTQVTIPGIVTSISAGGEHTLVLKSDNTVWAWGNNKFGQVGDVSSSQFTPVQVDSVSSFTNVKFIGTGKYVSFGIKGDDSSWSWGSNIDGELGNGTTMNIGKPYPVSGY